MEGTYMITKLINDNNLELNWGQAAEELKYIGDDLWSFNEQGELVFVKLHIYSHFGADSRIIRTVPEVMKYIEAEGLLKVFPKSFESSVVEPDNHFIYKDNVIVNYPGADEYEGALNVYNPCHGFYILTTDSDLKILNCIIQQISDFELQMESKTDRVLLSTLPKNVSSMIIQLLTEDWIYNDDYGMLPNMITKWENKLKKLSPNLPNNLHKYCQGIIEFWKEMVED